jgi:hypothetical protein
MCAGSMVDKKKCFVIMPFSQTKGHDEEYWTRHFNSFLKPLIEKNEAFEACRSQPIRGDIASQIITDLGNSDVVVADLTDYNPNVFWELGVRQSFKDCTITIAEKNTQIPFHFSHKGVFYYNADHLENQEFEKQFLASLQDCLERPNEPDSPVLVALGGRGTFYSLVHSEENKRRTAALKMEIAQNEKVMQLIFEHCIRNKSLRLEKKGTECRMVSVSLKSSAAEFLHVNRYLDFDEEFYVALFVYFTLAATVNRRLEEWMIGEENAENWLLENEELIKRTFTRMSEYAQKLK